MLVQAIPNATRMPFGRVTPDNVPRVFYVSEDNHINELRLLDSGWTHADLSAIVSNVAPAFPASGRPFAYVTADGVPRIVYRGGDNHIHELRLQGSWIQADLSAIVSDNPPAFPAAGDPFAFVTSDGIPRVLYRGADNHIHELRLQNSWIQADLSSLASAKADRLTITSGLLTTSGSLPLDGFVTVVMNKSGDYSVTCHAHNSGALLGDSIDYVLSAVMLTPTGFPFSFQHSGNVSVTDRDNDFVAPVANNPLITRNWNDILQADFQASIDGKDHLIGGIEGALGDLVKSTAQELGKAATQALIKLL
jgi:hypothetical protein